MEVLKKDLQKLKLPVIVVLVYCIFMQILFGTVCPIKAFLGIPCPGCGLTHASIYLVIGRFKDAMNSNATVILWWLSIILFCIDRYIHKLKINVFPLCFIITSIASLVLYFAKYLIMKN